ncbi:MAG: DUF4173 domain-containing protein, partial [Micrococcales bacterium]|nr:DUF4173 domain-containing protein [Micrococcales bacterium]
LIAWIAAGAIALLCFANTDGIIADYNVNQYLDGARIDVSTIANLNDAAVPALRELADRAPDPQLRSEAAAIIAERTSLAAHDAFADWNLQSHMLR